MKTKLLVHPSYARTVLSEDEAARLRQAGWHELPDTAPVSKDASKHRRFREKCRQDGLQHLCVYVKPETNDALKAMRRPGETLAMVLDRLVELQHLLG